MGKLMKNGVAYGGGSSSAATTSYSNTTSGLASTNVQGAIDTISSNLSDNQKQFIFGFQDEKYGYYTSSSRGADSFVPFSLNPFAIYDSFDGLYEIKDIKADTDYCSILDGSGVYLNPDDGFTYMKMKLHINAITDHSCINVWYGHPSPNDMYDYFTLLYEDYFNNPLFINCSWGGSPYGFSAQMRTYSDSALTNIVGKDVIFYGKYLSVLI